MGLGLAERDEALAGGLRAFGEADLAEAETVTAFGFVVLFFFAGPLEAFAFSAEAF